MIIYVIKRLLLIIPVVLGVAVLIFTILYFVPGDPATLMLPSTATQADIAAKRAQLGLDQPYLVQLGSFLWNLLRGELGTSYMYGTSVWQEICLRFPRTLMYASGCMVLKFLIGLVLGSVAAVHRNKWVDRLCMVVAMFGISLPDFFVALVLVLVFALKLQWLPPLGVGGPEYYILPVIAGSFTGIGVEARQARSSVLEVINADYVTTARAKGLPEWKILIKHILSNALIPVVQLVGNGFGVTLAGAIILENVFSLPGMGTYLTAGVQNRDYPIVRGSVVVLAVAFSLVMLLVDLSFAFLDPRIKAQYEAQGKKRQRGGAKNG